MPAMLTTIYLTSPLAAGLLRPGVEIPATRFQTGSGATNAAYLAAVRHLHTVSGTGGRR